MEKQWKIWTENLLWLVEYLKEKSYSPRRWLVKLKENQTLVSVNHFWVIVL